MKRTPIHPGEILEDEIKELGFSIAEFARIIQVPVDKLYRLIAGKGVMTGELALRLSKYFGNTAEFWMNLQKIYDLDVARNEMGDLIMRDIPSRIHAS